MDAAAPPAVPRPEREGASGRWDIFCHVVDNYGDVGGCWRLACGLAQHGVAVRLLVDDAAMLRWMAPRGCLGVEVLPVPGLGPDGFRLGADPQTGGPYEAADVLVTTFGCQLPADVLEAAGRGSRAKSGGNAAHRVWIHLEYLSAEAYVERSHGLASPLAGAVGEGVRKWFYFPGFTPSSGGLMREPDLFERMRRFDRAAWLAARGVAWAGETVVSLFCYEPPLLGEWLAALADAPVRLLVAHGRPAAAYEQAARRLSARGWNRDGRLQATLLPLLEQAEFDCLLWASDLNFVRGEDSLVRALWAGKAFVWHAYPQDHGAQRSKVDAFLDWLRPPESLRRFTLRWNGLEPGLLPPMLQSAAADGWSRAVERARAVLLEQDDLVTRLLRFVAENTLK